MDRQSELDSMIAGVGSGQPQFDAELFRLPGELFLHRDSPEIDAAEAVFTTVLAIAGRERTRTFEVRAVLAPALAHFDTGRAPTRTCAGAGFYDSGI